MFRIAVTDADGVVCQWRSPFESVEDAQARLKEAASEFPKDNDVSVQSLVVADDGESASWEEVE